MALHACKGWVSPIEFLLQLVVIEQNRCLQKLGVVLLIFFALSNLQIQRVEGVSMSLRSSLNIPQLAVNDVEQRFHICEFCLFVLGTLFTALARTDNG